jgi:hypothetical protein
MKKFLGLSVILVTVGCDGYHPDYDYSSRKIAKNEYEIIIKANYRAEPKDLKNYLRIKGDEECGHRIFRMRGLREDSYSNPPAQVLKAEIECMNTSAHPVK